MGVPSRNAPTLARTTFAPSAMPVTATTASPLLVPRRPSTTVLWTMRLFSIACTYGAGLSVRTALTGRAGSVCFDNPSVPWANRPWRSASLSLATVLLSMLKYTSTPRLPACAVGLMRAIFAATGMREPSTNSSAVCPTLAWLASSALSVASSSRRLKSTISTMRVSMPTRSPFCAIRWATWPEIGAFRAVSATDFAATSVAERAALYVDLAEFKLA